MSEIVKPGRAAYAEPYGNLEQRHLQILADHLNPYVLAGTGYGLFYTPEAVRVLLEENMASNRLIKDQEHALYPATLMPDTRIRYKVLLTPSSKSYGGGWYWQGAEPTCAAWSVINASSVVGVKPDPNYLANLLNYARKVARNENKIQYWDREADGLMLEEAAGILEKYPQMNLILRMARSSEQLEFLLRWPRSYDSPVQADQTEIIFFHNGRIIKRTIDQKKLLIVAVQTSRFDSSKVNEGHAICISGYKIPASRFMDIQIIDPAAGVFWITLEHLSYSLVASTTFEVSKKQKTVA